MTTSTPAAATATNLAHAVRQALAAGRANLKPGLVIQALMLAVVLGYYLDPTTQTVLNQLAELKATTGVAFAIAISVLGGCLLPELLRILFFQRGRATGANARALAILVPFWCWIGVQTDLLYRLQAWLFGADADVPTVVCKVLFDQFLYTPLLALPMSVVIYRLREPGPCRQALINPYSATGFRQHLLPALFACWAVWIPLTAIIYSLPSLLQIPLFGLSVTFWSLILAFMTSSRAACGVDQANPTRQTTTYASPGDVKLAS